MESQAFYHDLDFVLVNWELSLGYALTSWMTAEVRLPLRLAQVGATFLNEAGAVLPDFESIHHRNETLVGLGDITLGARFSVLPADLVEGLLVLASAGITAPTGGIQPNPFVRGRNGQIHQHVFFGTGTIDPYAALAVAYQMTWLRLLGFVHARGSLYANRFGYQGTGNIYGGVDVASDFGLEVFDTSVGVHVLHENPATWGEEAAENSGRTDLLVALGVSWQLCDAWRLHTGFKVPVWSEVVGGQLEIPIIWDLGVRFVTRIED